MSSPNPLWVARLQSFVKHRPSCNSRIGQFRCGATNGRAGACPNRATVTYVGSKILRGERRTVTYHRCDEHPLARAKSWHPLPFPAPCSCGLDDLLAEMRA